MEGSGAEAVVPLEKNKHWIKAVANEMKEQIKQPSRLELYRQTKNLLNLVNT